MKKNVLVSIKGLQHDVDESEELETIQPGIYRRVNGKHVIKYEEFLDEENNTALANASTATNTCLLKIEPDHVVLTKKGATKTEMDFKANTQHTTLYDTPMGTLHMSIFTTQVAVTEEPDKISVKLSYSLEMNYTHVSDCTIEITIK